MSIFNVELYLKQKEFLIIRCMSFINYIILFLQYQIWFELVS